MCLVVVLTVVLVKYRKENKLVKTDHMYIVYMAVILNKCYIGL